MPRLKQGDVCEPCGACDWCTKRWDYKQKSEARGRENRHLRKLLVELAGGLQCEIDAAMAGETEPHPTYTAQQRLVDRAVKALKRSAP